MSSCQTCENTIENFESVDASNKSFENLDFQSATEDYNHINPQHQLINIQGNHEINRINQYLNIFSKDFREDVIMVLKVAFPAMIVSFSQFSLQLIQQVFVARIGNDELAAVAVSNTWLNTPIYFILGVMTALDTLASQAYGAGDKIAIMQHWVESIVTMCILSAPLVGVLVASGFAARTLFGESEKIASLVGQFCYCAVPGLLCQMFGTTVIKVLQTQNILMAPALITFLVFVIFIPIQSVFINFFGFIGSSIALSLVRFLWMALIFAFWMTIQFKWWKSNNYTRIDFSFAETNTNNIYNTVDEKIGNNTKNNQFGDLTNYNSFENSNVILNSNSNEQISILEEKSNQIFSSIQSDDDDGNLKHRNSKADTNKKFEQFIFTKQIIRQGFSKGLNLKNIQQFLKLGLAGGFMLSAEALSFDLPLLFVTRLGTEEVDAHASDLITGTITFVTFTISFAVAATILVGNYLGAKQPQKAKQLGFTCVFLASFFMILCSLLMLIFREQIGYIYSDDENIVSLIKLIVFPLAAFQLLDGIQGSCQGVLRGCGRQLQLFLINIVGFWGCGVPMEIILCFVFGFGLQGIWWGITIGVLVVSILTLVIVNRIDWENEVCKIQKSQSEIQITASDEEIFGKLGEKYDIQQKDVELVPLM